MQPHTAIRDGILSDSLTHDTCMYYYKTMILAMCLRSVQ